MTLYCWDSFERKFMPAPIQDQLQWDERVSMKSLQVSKGESVSAGVASGESLICLLRGAWQVKMAGSQLTVRHDEAVIIPKGFSHSAEAIEDSFALQMVREQETSERDCLWGV
jgi:quercetin dioxygenase-like cupin family protein